MRKAALFLALTTAWPVAASAANPADLQALERAWHRCLREAYGHQPAGQSQAGDERNALDECKPREDAYVAALMADRPETAWTSAWAALVEPLTNWLGALRR